MLAQHLAEAMPQRGSVLSLGGDSAITAALMRTRRDLQITEYDAGAPPFASGSFDYVTLVDVLHRARDPHGMLAEATRLAIRGVVVKDHLLEGIFAGPTLWLLERIRNGGQSASSTLVPPRHFCRAEWDAFFRRGGCDILNWQERLGLYPRPASFLLDRHLHFVASLARGPLRSLAPAG